MNETTTAPHESPKKSLIVEGARYRGVVSCSKVIKYLGSDSMADSECDDVKNVFKEEVKSRDPKYELCIAYASSKGGLKLKTFKCGQRGSIDILNTNRDLADIKRKKFGAILVDHPDFDVANIDKTGGILNYKFWEKNLDWCALDSKDFLTRLNYIDGLLRVRQ